ncbi:hypothetical protein AKJ09_09871 [Labilithrix luteola]|uniref:Uncharacterized protein n=2 Tax=Labilithrix luteola TaxID=1391654 RepID=A0A0K1QBW1_9BACT|nr:hypothetical protein AKJ09_09871 [Labilithrix luteola]
MVPALVILAACGEPEPVVPSKAEIAAQRRADVARQREAEAAAMRGGVTEAQSRAAEESARQTAANDQVAVEKMQSDLEQRRREANEKVAKELARTTEDLRQACTNTRPKRAESLKVAAKQRLDFARRAATHAREIRSSCKLMVQPTGRVDVRRTGSGFQILPEQRDSVSCPGGVPRGFTLEEVWVVLAREQPGGSGPLAGSDEAILTDDDRSDGDRACRDFDAEAGLDSGVRYNDAAGIQRFLGWSKN